MKDLATIMEEAVETKRIFDEARAAVSSRRRSSMPGKSPAAPSKYEVIDLKVLGRDAANKARELFNAKKAEVLSQYNDFNQVPPEGRAELHRLVKAAYDSEFEVVSLAEGYQAEMTLLTALMHSETAYKQYATGNNTVIEQLMINDAKVSESAERDMNEFEAHRAQEKYTPAKRAKDERYELLEKARTNAWKIKGKKVDPAPSIFEGSREFTLFLSRNDVAKTGYAGVAYINEGKNSKEIIIGNPHLCHINDMRSVTALYHGFVPNQFEKSLKPYLDSIINKLKAEGKNPSEFTFTLTGFSLGAALSDLGAAYLHEQGYKVATFGIDNPGTGKIYDKVRRETRNEIRANKKPLVVTKPSQPDPDINNYITSKQTVANSINPQVGTVHIFREHERPEGLDKHNRPDRIFKLSHLMHIKGGLRVHSEANYNLKQDNTSIINADQPSGKKHTSSPVLRVATTCLAVPVVLPFLLASAPFVCIYKGVKKAAKAVEKHRHKDDQPKPAKNIH